VFLQKLADGVVRHPTEGRFLTYCDGPNEFLSTQVNRSVPVAFGVRAQRSDLQGPLTVSRSEVERPIINEPTTACAGHCPPIHSTANSTLPTISRRPAAYAQSNAGAA
jgi:hypothetical protein